MPLTAGWQPPSSLPPSPPQLLDSACSTWSSSPAGATRYSIDPVVQFVQVVGHEVGQPPPLQPTPHRLHRVQVRGVRRQPPSRGRGSAGTPGSPAPRGRPAVPDDDHLPPRCHDRSRRNATTCSAEKYPSHRAGEAEARHRPDDRDFLRCAAFPAESPASIPSPRGPAAAIHSESLTDSRGERVPHNEDPRRISPEIVELDSFHPFTPSVPMAERYDSSVAGARPRQLSNPTERSTRPRSTATVVMAGPVAVELHQIPTGNSQYGANRASRIVNS